MSSENGERLKKSRKNYSRAFEVFGGEYVTLVVKSIKGGNKGKIINLMLAGYLIDECEDYFYIGENMSEIFASVRKDEVASFMKGDASEEGISVPDGQEVQ